MPEFSTCTKWRCGHRADGTVAVCPKCGGKMETSRRVRTLGWIMLFLGIFLAGFMGYISWYLYPTMANPGKEIGGTTYTGTTEAATKFFGIFALVIFLGLVSIAGGIWQITTGRRSRIVMLIAMIFAAILITAAWLVEFGLLGD